MAFSKQNALDTIDAEIDKLNELERQVEIQAQDIQDLATELLAALPEEEQREAAKILYWAYAKWIPVRSIAEAVDIRPHTVCKYVGKAEFEISCRRCKAPIKVAVKSRDGYAREKHFAKFALCGACKERIVETREKDDMLQKLEYEKNIQDLRSMPYTDYLKTEHWQYTRTKALKRARYRCQLCNRGNISLHVHHRTYENRGYEQNDDLIVLCADCHRKFHDIDTAAASTA